MATGSESITCIALAEKVSANMVSVASVGLGFLMLFISHRDMPMDAKDEANCSNEGAAKGRSRLHSLTVSIACQLPYFGKELQESNCATASDLKKHLR